MEEHFEEHVEYQLVELMGDKKTWSRVMETKEEANYEEPRTVTFRTAELAKEYGNKNTLRWKEGALDRGVVRVIVVKTSIYPLLPPPKPTKKGSSHYHAKDALFEATYPDSIYDQRLFLTDDGRKRGLWIWLEEDHMARIESDGNSFQRGFKRFVEYLKTKKLDLDKPEHVFDLLFRIKMDFDLFFSHRTEASAIRLSWRKSKLLAAALNKAHRDEKNKTLEDYDDAYGKDADDDGED